MVFGAKGAKVALMTDQGDTTTAPSYGDAEEIDGVNEVSESLNFAEAAAYGDNMQKIKIRQFTDGTLTTQQVWGELALMSELLGTDSDENGHSYGSEDNAPFAGYGFYTTKMDSNKKIYYEVVFYPKCQAYTDNHDYKTKEDSITLEYEKVNFYVYEANCGKYKVELRFETETEAIECLAGLLAGTYEIPGIGEASA